MRKDLPEDRPEASGAATMALAEQVTVGPAKVTESADEGLLALAVGTGLQVMAALFEEDVAALCWPAGKHNPNRVAYRHGTEAGSVTLGVKDRLAEGLPTVIERRMGAAYQLTQPWRPRPSSPALAQELDKAHRERRPA